VRSIISSPNIYPYIFHHFLGHILRPGYISTYDLNGCFRLLTDVTELDLTAFLYSFAEEIDKPDRIPTAVIIAPGENIRISRRIDFRCIVMSRFR
jgi:hypothetical protein